MSTLVVSRLTQCSHSICLISSTVLLLKLSNVGDEGRSKFYADLFPKHIGETNEVIFDSAEHSAVRPLFIVYSYLVVAVMGKG